MLARTPSTPHRSACGFAMFTQTALRAGRRLTGRYAKKAMRKIVFILVTLAVCHPAFSNCVFPGQSVEELKREGVALAGPLSVEAVENSHLVQIKTGNATKGVPFGYVNAQWLRVKRHVDDGAGLFFIKSQKSNGQSQHLGQ